MFSDQARTRTVHTIMHMLYTSKQTPNVLLVGWTCPNVAIQVLLYKHGVEKSAITLSWDIPCILHHIKTSKSPIFVCFSRDLRCLSLQLVPIQHVQHGRYIRWSGPVVCIFLCGTSRYSSGIGDLHRSNSSFSNLGISPVQVYPWRHGPTPLCLEAASRVKKRCIQP
ncbi:uncharacterized protein YALI1_E17815g [Yarrowia lipolytica]|uniref:Uncharacterized protein n=1 Tax=Yarrowia lipolytica TaxID=4952 RepID=A0A1D8NIG8_YARLL|nr:hypothetical protein YALI1_E17815g [Yarrowia lipolytica]